MKREYPFLAKPLPGDHSAANHSLPIHFRAIALPADIPLIAAWLNQAYPANKHKQQALPDRLLNMYTFTQQSSSAQSLMTLAGDEPVCLADIYDALQDELYLYYKAMPGDYIMRLLFNAEKKHIPDFYSRIMQAIVKHLCAHAEVKRVIIETDNTEDVALAKACGFNLLQPIKKKWTEVDLYYVEKG